MVFAAGSDVDNSVGGDAEEDFSTVATVPTEINIDMPSYSKAPAGHIVYVRTLKSMWTIDIASPGVGLSAIFSCFYFSIVDASGLKFVTPDLGIVVSHVHLLQIVSTSVCCGRCMHFALMNCCMRAPVCVVLCIQHMYRSVLRRVALF